MAISAYSTTLNCDHPYKIYWGTAAPTAGDFGVGDWVINTAPSSGGACAWVCTTASSAGNGGTWKQLLLETS